MYVPSKDNIAASRREVGNYFLLSQIGNMIVLNSYYSEIFHD